MTKARPPRVEIEPTVYDALCVEGIRQHKSPKDLVNQWIMERLSPEVREFLGSGAQTPMDTKAKDTKACAIDHPMSPKPHDPVRGAVTATDFKPEKPNLANNPTALAKIKELWESGEHNQAEIARQIDCKRSTVAENIRKMKERGELAEESKSSTGDEINE